MELEIVSKIRKIKEKYTKDGILYASRLNKTKAESLQIELLKAVISCQNLVSFHWDKFERFTVRKIKKGFWIFTREEEEKLHEGDFFRCFIALEGAENIKLEIEDDMCIK